MITPVEPSRAPFAEQVLPHLSALYRFALHLSGEPAQAEDLVQDTMLLGLGAWDRLKPASNVRAWLMTILRHRFYNEYHRGQRLVDLEGIPDATLAAMDPRVGGSDPEGRFFGRIIDAQVRAAVLALPVEYREALVLSDVEGMTYAEIAKMLGVPVGTVRSRLFRARRALQATLHDYAVASGYVRAAPRPAPAGAGCQADRSLLLDYLKQELSPAAAERIREHLEVCCDCDACVRFERHYLALVRTALERQRCPERTREAVLARLIPRGRREAAPTPLT